MSSVSDGSPTVVRTPSSSHRQPSYPSSERPHRTPSAASRAAAPTSVQRPPSSSQSHGRSPSQQESLARVVRRDYEQTNLARPSSSSRRASQDRNHAGPAPARTGSTRDRDRSSSTYEPEHHAGDASTRSPAGLDGLETDNMGQSAAAINGQTRRRTTIELQTGTWTLGKTIGAGSMGKVKLARNLETGEQV